MYWLLFFAIVALIVWKIIADFSIALVFVPLGLFIIFVGKAFKEESFLGGMLAMVAGVAMIVLSIINREVTLEMFTDYIPQIIMFWKK